MMNIVFGAVGVLAVLGLLALGFFMGWTGRQKWTQHTARAAAQEASEQEKREAEAFNRAFDQMMHYNAETAYGVNVPLSEIAKEE